MSKEIAKKLITELETNEELKAKVEGITDPEELLKIALDSGYDVTMEELIEAEHSFRTERAAETDEKLSFDDLEDAAGGRNGDGETAPDGHEMGCIGSYHLSDYSKENNIWCNSNFYCNGMQRRCSSGDDQCSGFHLCRGYLL